MLQQIITSGIAQVIGAALGGVAGGGASGVGGVVSTVAGVATGPSGFGSPGAMSLAGAAAAPC